MWLSSLRIVEVLYNKSTLSKFKKSINNDDIELLFTLCNYKNHGYLIVWNPHTGTIVQKVFYFTFHHSLFQFYFIFCILYILLSYIKNLLS